MIDVSKTIAPKSDQLNADDLIAGPRTITIRDVKSISGDQPIAIFFEGDNGKPFKPCKSMRRVMVTAWGKDGTQYVGRSLSLFNDPNIKFGGANVGGIRISHMSHIEKPFQMLLTTSRSKRAAYSVQKLELIVESDLIDSDDLLARAEQAASSGLVGYERWFLAQDKDSKLFLFDSGDHETLKITAQNAGGANNNQFPGDS